MKRQLIALSLMTASMASADCPDLQGTYKCEEGGFSGSEGLTITQNVIDGVQVYTINKDDSFAANGKLSTEEWSVPQAAGGLMLTQFLCEDNALVVRIGLNYGFIEEKRFSKNTNGDLVQESIRVSLEGPETEELVFAGMAEAAEKIFESTEDREEGLILLKKLIEEKAPGNWKAAKESGHAEIERVECHRI